MMRRKSSGRGRFTYERPAPTVPPDPNLVVTLGSDDEDQQAPSSMTRSTPTNSSSSRRPTRSSRMTSLNALAATAPTVSGKRSEKSRDDGEPMSKRARVVMPSPAQANSTLLNEMEDALRSSSENQQRGAMDIMLGDDDDDLGDLKRPRHRDWDGDDDGDDDDDDDDDDDGDDAHADSQVIAIYKKSRKDQLRQRHALEWDMLNHTLERIRQRTSLWDDGIGCGCMAYMS